MGIHDAVQGVWRDMVKSSAYIKHFRHQCTTLIQLSRHFSLKFNHGRTDASFQLECILLENFLIASNDALNIVRDGTSQRHLDRGEEALKKAKKALQDYLDYTRTFDIGYDDLKSRFLRPLDLLDEAQGKDRDRAKHIINLELIKKPGPKKDTKKVHVIFCVHDGAGGRMLDLEHKLCRSSTIEEVIFKFNRADPRYRIGPLDHASFYTEFKSDCCSVSGLRIPQSITGEFSWHEPISETELQSYLKAPSKEPTRKIHVLVDRNPRVQVLMEGPNWARTYSLLRAHSEDRTMLMKGVDGKLYYSQTILRKYIERQPSPVPEMYKVYQVDREQKRKAVTIEHSTQSGWPGVLQHLHQEIITRSKYVWVNRPPTSEPAAVYKWLLQFPSLPIPSTMAVQIPPDTSNDPAITETPTPPAPRSRLISRAILPASPPMSQLAPSRVQTNPRPAPTPGQLSTTTPPNLPAALTMSDPSVSGTPAGSTSGFAGGSQGAQALLKGISAQDSEKPNKGKPKSIFGKLFGRK